MTLARLAHRFITLAGLSALLSQTACKGTPSLSLICNGGTCVDSAGRLVYPDGTPVPCNLGGTCSDGATFSSVPVTAFTPNPNPQPPTAVAPTCYCTVSAADSDGDCIPNALERGLVNHSGNPNNPDSDGDGVRDGCEDSNRDGIYQPGEMDPSIVDTDGDGILDGTEDANKNGIFDYGETSAVLVDTDSDGINDGVEDRNKNGTVDAYVDLNGNGCFDAGDTPGESDPRFIDTDRDGIPDNLEDKNGNGVFDADPKLHETVAFSSDSDCDLLTDGLEDSNGNGLVDAGETDPRSTDTDGDGLADGLEDANHDGVWDPRTETDPRSIDSDGDGLGDGVEDRNFNGRVDAFVDINHNGCWSPTQLSGETDPRLADSDGDGLPDGFEDRNHNGLCDVVMAPDPLNPQNKIYTYVETCGFSADSDCDGLSDGVEDRNHNGVVDAGETDPRNKDSDYDTLTDGCFAANPAPFCEDKNNNGLVDAGETSPFLADSDGDKLSDSCEVNFGPHPPAGGSDPLNPDSNFNGVLDGDEDANHNCLYDGPPETDPRVILPPPLVGDANYPQYSVCGANNLESVTFAASSRTTQDYRLALEVEKVTTGSCTVSQGCAAGQSCIDNQCTLSAQYQVKPYGRASSTGFDANNIATQVYGSLFASPLGIVPDPVNPNVLLSRQIYGFVNAVDDGRALDDILDNLRNSIGSLYAGSLISLTEMSNLPSRPAFDTLPNAANPNVAANRVNFAQRQLTITIGTLGSPSTPVPINPETLRDRLLRDFFLADQAPDPAGILAYAPQSSHGPSGFPGFTVCSGGTSACYSTFRVYIGVVQRLDQLGPSGKPVIITTLALTPDDSDPSQPSLAQNRYFPDRVTRLQDLTGGSALARFNASLSHACDKANQTLAHADLLWVVDDSRSMQQIISRLQQAATAAQNVLTANSGIVDFRLAMTTTNPSSSARALCPTGCDAGCLFNNSPDPRCDSSCADVTSGCIKLCPPTLSAGMPTGCAYGASCTSTTSGVCSGSCTPGGPCVCSCTSLANTNGFMCGVSGLTPGSCVDPNSPAALAAVLANDANFLLGNSHLPGSGGSFYMEDTQYLDCIANSQLDTATHSQTQFLNPCSLGSPPLFQPFYNSGFTRKQLSANARLLHSDSNASCTTSPLNLYYNTNINPSQACSDAAHPCCQRLTSACTDGPTVLASQMCDLIRAMGGIPGIEAGGNPTDSARRHSGTEHGTRSARRSLQNMLPALPRNWLPSDSAQNYDPNQHLRLNCDKDSPSGVCWSCDPTAATPPTWCKPVPLATIFLSDEEDFYFKDDCVDPNVALSRSVSNVPEQAADKLQLPLNCRYVDGDPNTVDLCTAAYCAGFPAGVPTGTNHDVATATADPFFSLQWHSATAPECSAATPATTCATDICPSYVTSGTCPAAACFWTGSLCINHCAQYTPPVTTVSDQSSATAQYTACTTDPKCAWDSSQVLPFNQQNACVPKYPANDCQACKRFNRNQETLVGGGLPGMGKVGPSYGIIRNKGAPGFGGWTPGLTDDTCHGGSLTWGRGDGQALRDLSISTLGRTQDICASDYSAFMELLTADIAVLSRPYPLSGNPVAATLKVGLARPNGSGGATYIAVPRSSTSGFFYDPTGNGIGFKSDPIDGVCGGGACSANGTIEPAEVQYARTGPTVPQTGDVVYISYRSWVPPPCLGNCAVGTRCASVICTDRGTSFTCSGSDSSKCPPGYTCSGNSCILSCTPSQVVSACVASANCGACQNYDSASNKCVDVNNTCLCNNTKATSCNPNGQNTCKQGYACDESCICSAIPGCTAFNGDGTVNSCSGALACCAGFKTAAAACTGVTSQAACTASSCIWKNGGCQYHYSTCCTGQEAVGCYTNGESGLSSLYCTPGTCDCAASKCASLGMECDPGNNCSCYTNPG